MLFLVAVAALAVPPAVMLLIAGLAPALGFDPAGPAVSLAGFDLGTVFAAILRFASMLVLSPAILVPAGAVAGLLGLIAGHHPMTKFVLGTLGAALPLGLAIGSFIAAGMVQHEACAMNAGGVGDCVLWGRALGMAGHGLVVASFMLPFYLALAAAGFVIALLTGVTVAVVRARQGSAQSNESRAQ